jgi:hypothetical protein
MYLMPPEQSDRLYHQALHGYEQETKDAVAAWSLGDNTAEVYAFNRTLNRTVPVPVATALYDALDDQELIDQWLDVLRKSNCSHVAALRTALAQRHIKVNGEFIAEDRAGNYDAED